MVIKKTKIIYSITIAIKSCGFDTSSSLNFFVLKPLRRDISYDGKSEFRIPKSSLISHVIEKWIILLFILVSSSAWIYNIEIVAAV
jgi:hypothetical protein